jgi:2-oxoglutarate dehydrogenase E1 component
VELFSSSCGRKVEDSEEEVTLIDRLEGKETLIFTIHYCQNMSLGFDYGYALANQIR